MTAPHPAATSDAHGVECPSCHAPPGEPCGPGSIHHGPEGDDRTGWVHAGRGAGSSPPAGGWPQIPNPQAGWWQREQAAPQQAELFA